MTTEQDAKSKVHLRLLGRSIGLPSEAREVIEIVWKAAAEFFQAQQPMPAWMQYDPPTDVLTIHGKKYAASLFGNSGFLGNAGDILRIEQGSDDVVTVTKIEPEQADKFATGGLRKNYIPPIPIWAGLGQNPMKPVPPVQPAGAQEPVAKATVFHFERDGKMYQTFEVLGIHVLDDEQLLYTESPAGAQGGFSWATGEPPKWFKEWFIAKLDNGQRVVLKRLPEEFTYDYTTADETYYAKRRIAKWMQFPDSEFVSLNPSPSVAVNEQLLESLKGALKLFGHKCFDSDSLKWSMQSAAAIAAAEAAKGGV